MRMQIAESVRKALARVRRIAKRHGPDRALGEFEWLLNEWPEHPTLLIEKARLIQLSENGSLKDARRALQGATQAAEGNPEAWIELGYYLLRVDERAVDAEAKFDQAITLAFQALADAVAGKIDAVLDQHPRNLSAERSAELEGFLRLGQTLEQTGVEADSAEIEALRKKLGEACIRLRSRVEGNGK